MLYYSEDDVKIKGIKIHYYRTRGDKPSFILLHGATDNGLCWTPVAELLVENYDVIMVDAQGHGLSDRLDDNFVYTNHADQVIGLIENLKLTKPIIMGHSMGAGTAVNIAVREPGLPGAIILEDPGWFAVKDLAAANTEAAKEQREAFIRELAGYGKLAREEIIEEGRKNNPVWSEAEIVPWAESKLQFDPTLFSKLQIDRPTYEELVPKIDCPTLLITSDGGIVSAATTEHAKLLWKSGKPFVWVEIKGAGHNIRREQFEKYCEVLFDFLKNLPE